MNIVIDGNDHWFSFLKDSKVRSLKMVASGKTARNKNKMENLYFITFAYGENSLGYGNTDWSTGDGVMNRDEINKITEMIRENGFAGAIVIGFSKYE